MSFTPEEYFRIWLYSIDGVGPARYNRFIEKYGSAENVWNNYDEDPNVIGELLHNNILTMRKRENAKRLFAAVRRSDTGVVFLGGEHYPKHLALIDNPPPLLFVIGRKDLSDSRVVSIVGTRRPTEYGVRMTKTIAEGLGSAGYTIVSGFALGIDTTAHEAALDTNARTIAVFACGIDMIYPPTNAALYRRLLSSDGSIISEYPPGTVPKAGRFPARNRIISGLAEGTLIVQGKWKSGAKITADMAKAQGRSVFVLPGAADIEVSELPYKLAREGARLVTNAADIISDLHNDAVKPTLNAKRKRTVKQISMNNNDNALNNIRTRNIESRNIETRVNGAGETGEPPRPLSDVESLVFEAATRGINDADDIADSTGLTASVVSSVLTILSLEGIIQ